ncbi:MAG: hypothetical protein P1U30_08975 [Phycisphaerales bacterium]|nr:hypothetical protein [Phycisphaerales bacterium]
MSKDTGDSCCGPHLSCLSWSVQAAMVCDTDRKVMTAEVEQNCSVSR